MKRTLAIGILGAATFVAICVSFGQGWMRRRWVGYPVIVNEWQKYLELTPDQTKKIESLQADFRSEMDKLIPALQSKVVALRELLLADKPNRNKIEATVREIEKLRTQQHLVQIDYCLNIRNVLTDEQRTKLRGMPLGCGKGLGLGIGWCGALGMGMGWRSGWW